MATLNEHPIHLGLGATAVAEPRFTGAPDWYEAYGERHAADGTEGRLVSSFTFSEPWESWEVHPHGHEVVVCVAGKLTLLQELEDGSIKRIALEPGEYAINEPGVWHTADVSDATTALFITAGLETRHRPR
jgi:quercetin dioxygenase-like cupin family protein